MTAPSIKARLEALEAKLKPVPVCLLYIECDDGLFRILDENRERVAPGYAYDDIPPAEGLSYVIKWVRAKHSPIA